MKIVTTFFLGTALLLNGCSQSHIEESDILKVAELPDSPLSFMYGEWRGTAKGMSRDGPYTLTQTERVGPMLNGDLVVVEGRGYKEDGSLAFNAFGVISYDKRQKSFFINAYTGGNAGKYKLEHTNTGFTWTIQAGPNAKVVNVATIENNIWHEVTTYIPNEGPKRITNDMTLTRIGDTNWPSSGIVLPKNE